jgi:hypothetical protein
MKRHIYSRWSRPDFFDSKLVVIDGGAAGSSERISLLP